MSVKIYIDDELTPKACSNCGNERFTNVENWDEEDNNFGTIHFSVECNTWNGKDNTGCREYNWFHCDSVKFISNQ